MKRNIHVLILGSATKTGNYLLKLALQREWHVTVLEPNPEKLVAFSNDTNLEILKGNVLHYTDVYNAVQGNDVVLSLLDTNTQTVDSRLLTEGTMNVIRAIRQSTIKKYICLSSLGAGTTKKIVTIKQKVWRWVTGRKKQFEIRGEQEFLLYQSTIDFTLVMAGEVFDDSNERFPYIFLPADAPCLYNLPLEIDRKTLAMVLLNILSEERWTRKTICVINDKYEH